MIVSKVIRLIFSKKIKIMDNSKIESLGWKPKMTIEKGLAETVKWYWDNKDKVRK
jgi:GDP-L-fucose synthase